MISFKMEIPENAWIDDPNGIALADIVNTYLPKNVRVFSILPSQKYEICYLGILNNTNLYTLFKYKTNNIFMMNLIYVFTIQETCFWF